MAKGNFNTDELTSYYAKIYAEVENQTLNDPYGNYILNRVKGGQKTIFNKTQSEIRNFDMSFLDNIESVYPALVKIMRDPKKTIRYEQEVVNVEKAKKTNSDTVRHLSSHTQYIREVTEDNVIPLKVLTTFSEDEIAIYENRFIKTLVKRIEKFLERRYDVMKVSLDSFETEKLNVNNVFLVSGQEVTINLDIGIKNDLTADVETTQEQYNRLLHLREQIQGLKGTDFMRALAKAKDVMPPIMKTNIILHNPDFKLAYGLWLYLDRVDSIATTVDIKEKSYKYTKIFDKDINSCMALALTSFIKNRSIDGIYASKKLETVKAPKPEENKELEIEMNLEADNNKLEDYQMNEVLLSQTAKFFEASLQGMQEGGSKYNESIRVVYRQMLDMLDQLYPYVFGVSDEELESKDLYEQLEFARQKQRVTKIVRAAKSMNIARMGKEEKRIEKLIAKLETKIKEKERKDREREEKERAKEEARRMAELEKERARQAMKKRLQAEAIKRQKEIEKDRLDAISKENELPEEKKAQYARMEANVMAKRNAMRDARDAIKREEEEALRALNNAPVRHKDEYDDMTDEELEALMNANDLFEKEEEVAPKPKKRVVKKAKPKADDATNEATLRKIDQNKDIEDMDADELEALMKATGIFDSNDLGNLGVDDTPLEKPRVGKKKAKPKTDEDIANNDLQDVDDVKEEPKKVIKKKAKEEPKPTDDDLGLDMIDDAAIDAALVNDEPIEEKPKKVITKKAKPKEEPKEDLDNNSTEEDSNDKVVDEEPKNEDLNNTPVEEVVETKPVDSNKSKPKKPKKPTDDPNDPNGSDDLDNLSDEELEELMKANDIF